MINLSIALEPAPINQDFNKLAECIRWVQPRVFSKSTGAVLAVREVDPADRQADALLLLVVRIYAEKLEFFAFDPRTEAVYTLCEDNNAPKIKLAPHRGPSGLIFRIDAPELNVGYLIWIREAMRRFTQDAVDAKKP